MLTDGVRRIADEIRNSLDFYRAQVGALAAERAVVTGSAVAIPGFVEALGDAIGLPADAGVVGEARPGASGGIDGGTPRRRGRPRDRGGARHEGRQPDPLGRSGRTRRLRPSAASPRTCCSACSPCCSSA